MDRSKTKPQPAAARCGDANEREPWISANFWMKLAWTTATKRRLVQLNHGTNAQASSVCFRAYLHGPPFPSRIRFDRRMSSTKLKSGEFDHVANRTGLRDVVDAGEAWGGAPGVVPAAGHARPLPRPGRQGGGRQEDARVRSVRPCVRVRVYWVMLPNFAFRC